MTTYGLTATGFRRKTYEETLADMTAFMRERITAGLLLDETTIEGNISQITADELDSVWEAAEAAVGALDPDTAPDALLVALCKLTGVLRTAAQSGHVSVSLTFDAATGPIPAGTLLLSVAGEATNLWSNDDEITVTGAGADSFDFSSTVASSAAIALAGTLTTIATPMAGLVSATNALDATPGTDIEDLDALRLRREASLGGQGKGTTIAIRAEVAAVDGIVDVRIVENDTDGVVDGVPARNIRVIVWDGSTPAADDDEIAQAIYDSKASGIPTYGASSGDATDPWGDTKPQNFDRADELEAYILITVTGSTTETAVKTALLAAHDEICGEDLLRVALMSAAFAVDGVTNVTVLTLGFAPAPAGTTDLAADIDEVITLDSSRIGVTIA